MKVVLYYPWIYLLGGTERTILEIVRHSRHQWTICTNHYDRDKTYPELKQLGIQEVSRVSVKRSYGAVIGAAAQIASTRLDLAGVDAVLSCCDGLGVFLNVRNAKVPIVNLCFTPLRAVYDMEYRKRHLARQGMARIPALLAEQVYKFIDRRLWRRYANVICISETVRERVAKAGLCPPETMRVIYSGVDAAAIAPIDRFEPFFFLPGRIMWTKNIELGIAAFHLFRQKTGSNFKLVIAGMVDAKSRGYCDGLRRLAADPACISFHESPTDAQMRSYYERCSAVLFTAFNEDLGITPMEAMARGKPVIAVNRGGPREVVEDQVSGYLVEDDPEAFSAAMAQLLETEGKLQAMGRAGSERMHKFTWQGFVAALDDHLDATVAGAKR